jgi:hypothetical protein
MTVGVSNVKPFFTLDMSNTSQVLDWLNSEINYQSMRWQDSWSEMRNNVNYYSGKIFNEPDYRYSRDRTSNIRSNPFTRRYNKIPVNHIADFTDARVSRLLRFDPSFVVTPFSNEFVDDVDSRVAEKITKSVWNDGHMMSAIIPRALTIADICGESYVFTDWNPFKGPKQKDVEGLPEDEVIAEVQTSNDTPGYITAKSVRMGDVDFQVRLPYHVMLPNVESFDKCDWIMAYERLSVSLLEYLYPNYQGDLKPDTSQPDLTDPRQDWMNRNDDATVYTFYHRSTLAMPKGRKVVFTKSAILENVEFPFASEDLPGPLPVTRFVGIQVPGQLRGISIYRHLKPLNDHLNTLTSMIVRNQIIAAHPKWVVPQGSVKLENLGNDITIVQYKGAQPPVLVSNSPSSPELFSFRDALKNDLQTLSLVFGTTRGEPPPGIKAGVALQFLNEQENERFTQMVKNYQASVVDLAQKTLLVIGNKYEDSDQRIIRAVGTGTGFDQEVVDFKIGQLRKKYNVQIQNSSALPESKAARTQNILDLQERFPEKIDADTALSLIGFTSQEKIIDSQTISIRSAQSENEKLIGSSLNIVDGVMPDEDPLIDPVQYEDHILHWKIHTAKMQESRFKRLPVEIQIRMRDHVMAHEMFMFEKAQDSINYAQALTALVGFPLFFKIPPPQNQTPLPTQMNPAMSEAESMPLTPEDAQSLEQGPMPDPTVQG